MKRYLEYVYNINILVTHSMLKCTFSSIEMLLNVGAPRKKPYPFYV